MQILELYMKNFGKFSDRHIYFSDHIQIFYGENEYGKSTIYAFIKAMLFGMERGRGRAAGKDEFSRYEPWENPNYYAGMMRFRCGGRIFRLERTFDRYTKSSSLVCEDDGEELSLEAGDLEMLLGGMTAASFENTAAIGQLTAKPGQALAAELKNYAANYYETGCSDVNLQEALTYLKNRRSQVEKEQKKHREEREKQEEKLELQLRYVEADAERLQEELTQSEHELEDKKCEQEKLRQSDEKETEGLKSSCHRKKAVCSVTGMILRIIGTGVLAYSWIMKTDLWIQILAAALLVVGVGLYLPEVRLRNYVRRQNDSVDGTDECDKTVQRTALSYEIQKAEWELVRIREELKEKQLQRSNLWEQLQETENSDETDQKLREKLQALKLAEIKIQEAAKETAHHFGSRMNTEASRILSEITNGRYNRLLIDESLEMTVLHEGKRIPAERLSRGTLEQVYFSLRMAALYVLYEEEIPVILDDAFVFYDEKRLKSVLKWLSEQPRQVIIFSCQTREKQLLEG